MEKLNNDNLNESNNNENLDNNEIIMPEIDRIDEVEEILEQICENIPEYAYDNLNGGIILSEETKFHEESVGDSLVILGEYRRDITGNMIKIYYGSFMEMFKYSSHEELYKRLEHTLLHEFTHHLEFMANEYGLVIEDKKFIDEYKKRYDK